MKFNWGTGIVLVSLLFMTFIVVLVVKTYQHKVDLVSEDYYSQELTFQDRIDKMNNVKKDADKVKWEMKETEIRFQFPTCKDYTTIKGTIEFFRPSEVGKDVTIPVQTDAVREQAVSKAPLLRGLYRLKLDWSADGVLYYTEEDIFIQ